MFLPNTALTPQELQSAIIRNPLVVSPETTVQAAITLMSSARAQCQAAQSSANHLASFYLEARSSCVLVVEARKLLGIFTERDVVRLSAQQSPENSPKIGLQNRQTTISLNNTEPSFNWTQLAIKEVMATSVVTLQESDFTDLFSALNLFKRHHIRHLPLVNSQDHVLGILTHETLRQATRPVDLLRLRLVEEVMSPEVVCARPDESMLQITQYMAHHRVSSVLIVDAAEGTCGPLLRPVGILTERDLVQFHALGLSLKTCRAWTVMSAPMFTVSPTDSLWLVQQVMEERLIRRLAVTGSEGELLGIVTQTSLLQALNPLDLFKLAENLEQKVVRLEAENIKLLENRTLELEKEVESRTIALKAKAEWEKLVAEIASQIRSSLSLQTILDTAVTEVRQFLQCDRVTIWRFDSTGLATALAESTGLARSFLGSKVQDTCVNQVNADKYRQGHIRVVDDIDQEPLSDCHRVMLKNLEIRAKILVPLLCGDELWGLLSISETERPRDWQTAEVELLQALAVHLAIAIQQATNHQQLQEQLLERQQSEARLRDSEQRYASLAKAVPVGIFRANLDGQYIYVNEYWSRLTGISPERALGQGWQQGIHPDDRSCIAIAWQNATQNNQDFAVEYRLQQPDGTEVWVYGQSVMEQNAQDEMIGFVGTLTNISDRKQAEQKLQKFNQSLEAKVKERTYELQRVNNLQRSILDGSDYSIISTDVHGVIQTFNKAAERMLGYTKQEVVGRMTPELIHDPQEVLERSVQLSEELGRTIEPGFDVFVAQSYLDIVAEQEWTYIRKDESRFPVLLSVTALKNLNQEIIGFLGVAKDISDHKKAELERQQLLQELSVFKLGLDQAAIVAITDAKGVMTYVNDRFCEISGYTSEEMLGQTHQLVSSGYHSRDFFKHLWLTIRKGKVWRGEICNRAKNGSLYWVESTIVPFLDAKGRPFQYLAIRFDITLRKTAEQALKQQLDAIEAAIDGIAILKNKAYLYCNQAHLHLFGYENTEELVGKTWDMVYSADELDRFEQDIFPILERDRSWQGEAIATRKDGSTFTEGLSLTLTDDDLLICVCRDISDHKRTEEALRESETRFRRVFDSNIVGMIFADFSGQVIDANDCFLDMLGYTRDDLQSQSINWANMTPLEYQQKDLEAIEHLKLYRAINPWEKAYYHQDGHLIPVLIGVALLSGDDGSCVCIILDISDRKKAEAQLQRANEELMQATRLKDEFLANMSHELRTPLNAILGITESLQDHVFGHISEKGHKMLKTIERSGNHLLELINDILDLAKIESGKMILDCAETNVEALCQSSLVFVGQHALNKGLELTEEIAPNLPNLMIDERRIRQVLINLLNNAVKFTPEGGKITLEVALDNEDNVAISTAISTKDSATSPATSSTGDRIQRWVRFTVVDTGIGIAPDDLKRLFQPFVQVDSALNRQYSGTGLGLSLVRRIIELHGGQVSVTSKPGMGSQFTVKLPYSESDFYCLNNLLTAPVIARRSSDEPRANAGQESGHGQGNQGEPTGTPVILLAEDNEINVITIASYLEARGYEVIFAKNGEEAIDLVQAEQPDLVLMDIQMPGMDGLEAIQQIRSLGWTDLPIIAVTALAMNSDRQRCLDAGANAYLSKPIKLKQLATIIQQFLTS